MNKMYTLCIIIILGLLISACSNSEEVVQTAIAQTQNSIPSETNTPKPTNTPTETPTPSPTFTNTPTSTPTPLPIEDRIIGKWSGSMTNKNNEKVLAYWTFLDDGHMIVEIFGFGVTYGADWYVEGNRLHLVTEMDPSNPTYRDIEFVNDDVIIMTKDEADIKETWTRIEQ